MATDTEIREVPDLIFSKLKENMATSSDWLPKIIAAAIQRLGPLGSLRMRYAVLQNNYTGALSRSITNEFTDQGQTVTIGPTALRGNKYDAGQLLELGVPHAIPNAPYKPIAAWASFRGAPMPGVWLGIRRKGVKAHPFLDNTLTSMESDLTLEQTVILDAMIEKALEGATL